ncbi:MAG: redox-sensing transcriptional repressor Rex [Candidatus Coatesbacteria bacterium]|nr:redox-sensing transcriptional repressor Rex [Candidatus Coatesbacteria bacterium]
MKNNEIPGIIINRFAEYLCCLAIHEEIGDSVFIQSKDLASVCKIKASLVRKDLSILGELGTKGKGYNVRELKSCLIKILNLDTPSGIFLIGLDFLGRYILKQKLHSGFLKITAAFDKPERINEKELNGVPVYSISQMLEIAENLKPLVGIICVDLHESQHAADLMIKAGIRGIITYVEYPLELPENILLKRISLSCELSSLSYNLKLMK